MFAGSFRCAANVVEMAMRTLIRHDVVFLLPVQVRSPGLGLKEIGEDISLLRFLGALLGMEFFVREFIGHRFWSGRI